jgi:ethanolaminephosphotransferase
MRNARQMLKVVSATFPEFNKAGAGDNCEDFLGSINKLACGWRKIVGIVADAEELEDVEPLLRSMSKVCDSRILTEREY